MLNKVILDARLSRDVELRYTQGGEAIATLNLANSEKTKKKDGSTFEKVVYVDCKLFGRTAEIANQYLKKGSRVLIEGKLNLETWEKNGVKNYKHTITGSGLTMLDSSNKPQTEAPQPQQVQGQRQMRGHSSVENVSFSHNQSLPETEIEDSDIPF